MKICIPTEEPKGLDSLAYGHFGSAPFFLLIETATMELEIIDNGNAEHEHGQCNPIGALAGKSVDTVIVGGMGGRALMLLNNMGIRVFRASAGMTAREILGEFQSVGLEQLTMENSCNHHGCH